MLGKKSLGPGGATRMILNTNLSGSKEGHESFFEEEDGENDVEEV